MRALLVTLVFATLALGCTGMESTEPPIVGIRNMYNQPRYDTQEKSAVLRRSALDAPRCRGHRSARGREVPSRGHRSQRETNEYWLEETPLGLAERNGGRGAFVARGKDRYDIFCAPCHSVSGDGKGMVLAARRHRLARPGWWPRPSTTTDFGTFPTVSSTRPSRTASATCLRLRAQHSRSDDRWAIVEYVRALQLSQAPQNTEQSQ